MAPSPDSPDPHSSGIPNGEDASPGHSDARLEPSGETETYKIPGGLSGWIPGEIPAARAATPAETKGAKGATPDTPGTRRLPSRRSPAPGWQLFGFNLLVFMSSICVMTLELTASRLIGKHVGSSLYTWTSVIGVVLAGITIGNSLGGWLADRYERARTLAWMFLLSSFACASVLWLDQLVAGMPRPESMSWPAWVLTVVALMFLVPAVLLGTTSPLVASMALERSTRLGTTVGNVYAWGAFGSIVGTFLTGFYLIDQFGTRAIIGMTAAALAGLAVIVAGGHRSFRAAVLLGWMQFLAILWLVATINSSAATAMGQTLGSLLTGGDVEKVEQWSKFGDDVGKQLHELGLLLKLRDDQRDAYHDESSYSYIQVRDDYVGGSPVKALRLDKLDHSYFDPAEPTKLHYEYEEVYAAITHRAAPQPQGGLSVAIPEFPGRDKLLENLPAGVTFDAARQQLLLTEVNEALIDELLRLSPDSTYWKAIEQLHRETIRPNWGGFSTVDLTTWPEGVTIPEALRLKLNYDQNLETLMAYDVVTVDDRDQLIAATSQAPWQRAIQHLSKNTTPLNTLFIGGGGFIFPRWILAEFPAANRVDVAELDPAVYEAVKQEMGLVGTDRERIRAIIGDARNFVDDQVRLTRRARATGAEPVTYDFIYGDAFNDFSVPWHLTTREFTEKLHELLAPRGVFLANIIEIYPRLVIPGGQAVEAFVDLPTPVPDGLYEPRKLGQPRRVQEKFRGLEILTGNRLQYSGQMSTETELELLDLAPEDAEWQIHISQLASRSRQLLGLPFEIPDTLRPGLLFDERWAPCPAPFSGLDIYQIDSKHHALGIRGAAPESLEQQMLALRPDDREWKLLVASAAARSRRPVSGRFLGRYVATMTQVFPYVAVFCTSETHPSDARDTFVVACSRTPLDLANLESRVSWKIAPFAEYIATGDASEPTLRGQMASILQLAEGQILTDDYAPVDNLLKPVFSDQGN